jgi:hypothetical protein
VLKNGEMKRGSYLKVLNRAKHMRQLKNHLRLLQLSDDLLPTVGRFQILKNVENTSYFRSQEFLRAFMSANQASQ